MKKIGIILLFSAGLSGVVMADTLAPVDTTVAINTFAKDLQEVRDGLDKGQMQPNQALVLLSAIEARQNQVLIAQNAEIVQLLKNQQLNSNKIVKGLSSS